nr:unnamed protein product [Callosobruchus chinensis]
MAKCDYFMVFLNICFIQVACCLEKCCVGDAGIVIQNNSYICENDSSLELSMIRATEDSENSVKCMEAFGTSIAVFNLTSSGYSQERNITDQLIRKCCPRNFRYDAQTHACSNFSLEMATWDQIFPIGLSHCSVIKDYQVLSMTDGLTVMNDTHVRLDQFSRVIQKISACLDETTRGGFIVRICEDIDICDKTKCIHKCCPDGQSFVNGSRCRNDFATVHGFSPLYPILRSMRYQLDSRGTLFVWDSDGNRTYRSSERSYCFEHATKNETRKVFGKCLVNLCFALLILFVMLAAYIPFKKKLLEKRHSHVCKTIGFLITYLSFSSFIWFQVLCFDIYRTFGSSSNHTIVDKKKRDLRRFLYYSLYGWTMPLLLTSLPALFHYVDILPDPIRVEMAITKCIIEKRDGNYAEIVFRIIPLSVIQVIDMVLFVKTIRYCLKVRRDIQKLNENNSKKKRFSVKQERFGLVIKLSVTMGMLFLFELVSSFTDFKSNPTTATIEIIWDVINCLQGLFIFIIFVCKRKTFEGCKKNIDVERLRKISLTSTTKVTSVSSSAKRVNKEKYKITAQAT